MHLIFQNQMHTQTYWIRCYVDNEKMQKTGIEGTRCRPDIVDYVDGDNVNDVD